MTYYDQTVSQAERDADECMTLIYFLMLRESDANLRALTSMHSAVEERVYWGIRRANIKWDMGSFEALINMQTWVGGKG